jgi:hypothetical protein
MAEHGEDKVHDGMEHLQAAAREVIKASRSLLDAAEELVEDPRSVQDIVATLTAVAQAAAARLRTPGSAPDEGDDDDGHVQRIRVS